MLAIATKGWPDLTAFWQTQASSPGLKSLYFPNRTQAQFSKGRGANLSAKMGSGYSGVEGVNHSLSGRAGGGNAVPHCPQTTRGLAGSIVPAGVLQFHSTEILKKLCNPARAHDPLYFLTHNYYISKYFSLLQRVQSAINHHQFELKNYSCEYARQVYRSSGVVLWERSVDNLHFTIVLVATEDNRHEGDLSVILSVDNIRLCRMSFCYLNAHIFGLTSHKTMLVSRNQTDRNTMLK